MRSGQEEHTLRLKNAGPDPEAVAIDVLTFLAEDPERLGRFLAITGIDPASLRRVAAQPRFLASVLGYLLEDESLLLAFASNRQLRPDWIATAHRRLVGQNAGPGPGDFTG
jgi:hypothetical protein